MVEGYRGVVFASTITVGLVDKPILHSYNLKN